MHESNVILVLVAQIAIILALSRVVGWLFSNLRQPQVIGEMVSGIMLGPSLLGWMSPGASHAVFPADSIPYLNILSQIGVVFYLFLIGLEFDPNLVRKRGSAALAVSASSIIAPFALGVALTFYLYPRVFNDPTRSHFLASALFMGAAISVTAFPVLARILTERNLHRTPIGAISIACAAVNDVLAWCMLAVVVAVAQSRGAGDAVQTTLFAGAYIAAVFLFVRPFLKRIELVYEREGRLSQNVIAIIFVMICVSAWITEKIGIHALFGAFMLGCVMPKDSRFVRHLSEKLEDFTVVFLLPIFFAYTGLRTDLTGLGHGMLVGYTLLIIAAACVGKFGGSAIAARLSGFTARESSAIGVLMNTRGLMELVILSIGLQLAVINEQVFAMMVVMALATTTLTTPLLHLVYPERMLRATLAHVATQTLQRIFTVLIPVADPRSGVPLLRMADMLCGAKDDKRRLLALHLRRAVEHEAYLAGIDAASVERDDTLTPILDDARRVNLVVEPISFVGRDVAEDIADVATARQADLVLMGFHKPVIGKAILGGTVHRVLTTSPSDVAVFVNRGLDGKPKRVLVPYLGSSHDRLALDLAGRIARNTGAETVVLHIVPPKRDSAGATLGAKQEMDRAYTDPTTKAHVTFRVIEDESPVAAVLREASGVDLVLIGVAEEFELESQLFGWRSQRIAQDCPTSLLIVRKSPTHRPAPPTASPASETTPSPAEDAPTRVTHNL